MSPALQTDRATTPGIAGRTGGPVARLREASPEVFARAPYRRPTRRGALLVIGALVTGTAVSLLRHPAATAFDTLWAEDAAVFLADAVHLPAVEALATSYAGYFHLVPRLLGAVAAGMPPAAAPAVISVCAAVVTAALAVLVYTASAGHLHSPVARALVAAPVVVAPLAMQEVPNSVANLHWPALYAAFWMLVWTPAGRGGRLVAPVVLGLIALSDFLILVFLPLAVARLALVRDRYSTWLAGVLTAGVAVQLFGLAVGASSRENLLFDPVRPARAYLLHVVPSAVFGERWLPVGQGDPRIVVAAALSGLLLVAAVVIAARLLPRPAWPLAIVATVHSVTLFALPVALTSVAPPRYGFAPALLLITALVAILQPAPGRPAPRPHRASPTRRVVPFAVLTVLLLSVWAINLRVDTAREDGPRWSEELERARVECTTSSAPTAELAISPDPWTAELSCHYLTGAGRP